MTHLDVQCSALESAILQTQAGQRGCFADLSLAQVDVLAVDRMLLLAWLPGWLLVIVLEAVLQVDNGRAGQCGGLLFCPLHRLMCWR